MIDFHFTKIDDKVQSIIIVLFYPEIVLLLAIATMYVYNVSSEHHMHICDRKTQSTYPEYKAIACKQYLLATLLSHETSRS